MAKPNLHLLGLAHTKTNTDYMACAYTQKILKMGKMMTALGYNVYHYGAEGSNLQCTEDIVCVTHAEQDYSYEGIRPDSTQIFKFNKEDYAYKKYFERAIPEINKRKQSQDILLCPMGHLHKPVVDAVKLIATEMGIGYTGVFADYKVFESYSWMHYIYGMLNPSQSGADGKFYDAVIPNYYDVCDFTYGSKKNDYILYIGRLTRRKGVMIAYETAKRTGHKLKIAGIGSLKEAQVPNDKKVIEYLGYVDNDTRTELMAGARAVMVPTLYLEPFGGVNVEAMFCGTPAITTDWGGFVDTVKHGYTGYRCRTIEQFCWAVNNTDKLWSPGEITKYAMNNYSLERVGKMYDEYFMQLQGLFGKGFYEYNPDRTELDWLRRY